MEGCFYIFVILVILSSPALLVVVIGYTSKINRLSVKVDELEWEIRRLRTLLTPPEAKPSPAPSVLAQKERAAAPQTPHPKPEPVTSPLRPSSPAPPEFKAPVTRPAAFQTESASQTAPLTHTAEKSERSSTPAPPTLPPPKPSRTRAEWESLIGGKLLNRIGALALIIGIGFFLRYAFSNNLITPPVRVMIGILTGAGLLFGGAYYHRREFQIFAQGLVGAGIAILYLSVYASFNFYHLVPQSLAFAMMAAVTTVTFFQAFKYDSFAVAFLGWTGGFLTPFLLSTGQANEIGLFTYIALLDAGLLAITARKDRWAVLEPLTFLATWLVYLLWYKEFYTPADLAVTVLFLTVFWGLFYALDIYRALARASAFPEIREVAGAFNAVFYYAAMYAIIAELYPDWMGGVTLAIGAVYFSTALAIKRGRSLDGLIFARHLVTAMALLVLATAIEFEGFITVFYWSVEAVILIWCAGRWKLRYVKAGALMLFALAFSKLLSAGAAFIYSPIESFELLLNDRALAFSTLAAAMCASAWLLKREDEGDRDGLVSDALLYGCCGLLFILFTVETNDHFLRWMAGAPEESKVGFRFHRYLALALVWMMYSFPLVWLGLKKSLRPVLNCGLAVLSFSLILGGVRGVWFTPIEGFAPVLNVRVAALIALLAGLLVHARWLKIHGEVYDWIKGARALALYSWCAVLFVLCAAEANDFFRHQQIGAPTGAGASIEFARNLTIAIVWMAASLPIVWYGLRKRLLPIIQSGLVAMACAVVWGVMSGISYVPIESFRWGFNFRAMSFGFMLCALAAHVWFLKNEGRAYSWAREAATAILYGWCALLFTLYTTEAYDYFRHHMAASSGAEIIGLAFKRDMTIAVGWMAYSLPLIWLGMRKRVSPFLHCGLIAVVLAVLLGAARGVRFEPLESFARLTNFRAAALLFIVAGLAAQLWWMRGGQKEYHWLRKWVGVFNIVIALLILELITVETWDHFQSAISRLYDMAGSIDVSMELKRLTDLKHLSLSVGWLLYSILLVGLGIMRRRPALRMLAILVFGISILKIFIYDLSFLETLYRIFSFIGLGLILLTVSYLYHRFKSLIFDAPVDIQ
ncbi:MAG: DUF2339 domain-containing protein [Blastocatellia bacterium]|nr:DUF2339 domain-containing protein [Blastocatellia bacterium]